jgi:transposase
MPDPLLVGLDVHLKTQSVCVMNVMGAVIEDKLTVQNTPAGAEALADYLHALASSGGYDAFHIAAEATGWYWWHFFRALSHDPRLQQSPLALYPLNPRLVAKLKQAYSDDDKTDPGDAFVVADRLRMGRDLPYPFTDDPRYLRLRLLTRHRRHLVRDLVREKSFCLAHLYLKASAYTQLQPFADTFGATSRTIIRQYASMEEIAAMPLDDLVETIDRLGKHRFADPLQAAQTLQEVARKSYPLPEALQGPVNLILRQTLQQITALERLIHQTDTAIAETMQDFPNILQTIPGFGPVFAGGIIAEIGDLSRFEHDQAKVAKYAGLKWRRTQSADFEAEETPMTQAGNRYLRYYLCEAANSVRMRDAEYQAYYERKYDEVRKHQHKRAIVLTARKLVRLVVRLLTTNQPYRPRRAQLRPAA